MTQQIQSTMMRLAHTEIAHIALALFLVAVAVAVVFAAARMLWQSYDLDFDRAWNDDSPGR